MQSLRPSDDGAGTDKLEVATKPTYLTANGCHGIAHF
jgi:hypothetical protein